MLDAMGHLCNHFVLRGVGFFKFFINLKIPLGVSVGLETKTVCRVP